MSGGTRLLIPRTKVDEAHFVDFERGNGNMFYHFFDSLRCENDVSNRSIDEYQSCRRNNQQDSHEFHHLSNHTFPETLTDYP